MNDQKNSPTAITEVQAFARLEESESRYRALFELAPDAILLIQDEQYIDCNQAALDMFQCDSKKEFLQGRLGDRSPVVQANGEKSRSLLLQHIDRCQTEGNFSFDWNCCRSSGELFASEVRLSFIEIEGARVLQVIVRDVTERKTEEEKTFARERQLKKILEGSPIGIVVSDFATGRIRFANKRMRNLLGIPADESIHKKDKNYWVDDSQRQRIIKRLEQDNQASGEILIRKLGGEHFSAYLRSQYNPGSQNEILSWVLDLTEQKNHEVELEEHDRVLQQILDNLPVALWAKDINNDHRYIISNKKNDELWGLTRGEILGHTDFELIPDRDAQQYLQEDQEVARLGGIMELPEEYLESDDGELMIARSVKLVVPDADGEPGMILGMREDITERRKAERALHNSEKRFRALARNAPVGIFLTDAKGACVYVNEQWQTMTGLSRDQVYGRGWETAIHEDDRLAVNSAWQDFVKGEAAFDMDYRFVCPDGHTTWVSGTAIAFRSEADELIGYLGTTTDISQSKQLASELQKSKEEAESANSAKSEFLSRMSHELRTPLNAVLGFGQLLQLDTEKLNTNQRDAVGHIIAGGEHLLRLIEDVLDLARIDSGHFRLKARQISTADVLHQSVALVESLAELKNIAIRIPHTDVPDIFADQQRVQQILVNLLSNAIKYNRKDGSVDVTACSLSQGVTRVSVRDSGIGIQEADWPRLFEPFERIADPEYEAEGTGIGLSICRKLVELMGGQLGFHSEVDVGSTFWFDLPGTGVTDTSASLATGRDFSSRINELDGIRFLYIEDHQASINLMIGIAQNIPRCEVSTATNAQDGVSLAKSSRPDLILMDINLPGLDGFEALEILRQDDRTREIPVIALSANAMHDVIEKGIDAGFAQFLTKPLALEGLFDAIASVLQLTNDH